jgi:DNA-binding protein YbaB
LLQAEEIGMVQDLVVAAVNAALAKSQQMVEAEVEKVTGGIKIPGLG